MVGIGIVSTADDSEAEQPRERKAWRVICGSERKESLSLSLLGVQLREGMLLRKLAAMKVDREGSMSKIRDDASELLLPDDNLPVKYGALVVAITRQLRPGVGLRH